MTQDPFRFPDPEQPSHGEGNTSSPASPLHLGRERLQLASPLLAVSVIFLVTAILQATVIAVVSRTAPTLADRDWYAVVLSMLPMYAVAMPFSLLLFRLGKSEPPRARRMELPTLLGLLCVCFLLTYAGNFVGNLVNFFLGMLTGEELQNPIANLTLSTPLWANLLFCGILAPIMEEVFYRKLVIDRFRRYGDLPAILLSGLMFGLVHGNFSQFFYAAALGMLFGYIYLNTGRIRYTILLHMGINLVGGVYATEMLRLLDQELLASDPIAALTQNTAGVVMYVAYLLFMGLMLVGGIIALILLLIYRRRPLRRGSVRPTPAEWLRLLLLNPGLWIFLLVILLLFL